LVEAFCLRQNLFRLQQFAFFGLRGKFHTFVFENTDGRYLQRFMPDRPEEDSIKAHLRLN
jgi:hypothetical protein